MEQGVATAASSTHLGSDTSSLTTRVHCVVEQVSQSLTGSLTGTDFKHVIQKICITD